MNNIQQNVNFNVEGFKLYNIIQKVLLAYRVKEIGDKNFVSIMFDTKKGNSLEIMNKK